MNSADIYWNIEMIREQRGMNDKEFCRIIGINEKTWGNYKKNPASMRFGVAEKASKIFGLPMEEITGRRFARWRQI